MSVDTYLKGKNLSPYRKTEQDGIQILVAPKLTQWATAVYLDVKQFLIWRSFEVGADHKHTITCAH